MSEWKIHKGLGFSVLIPQHFRVYKSGHIKGRLIPTNDQSEVLITILIDISNDIANEIRSYSKFKMSQCDSNEMIRRYWGKSISRQGGIEKKCTLISPQPVGDTHQWDLLYRDKKRWIDVSISNFKAGLDWDNFEAFGKMVIDSITIGGEAEKGRSRSVR